MPSDGLLTESQIASLRAASEKAPPSVQAMTKQLPAQKYTSVAHFELERRRVFMSHPVIVCPSAELAEPRTYFSVHLLDKSILLTRDHDNVVRAFFNVCPACGAVLRATREPTFGDRINCPRQACAYALNGDALRSIALSGANVGKLALTQLACLESGGLVWVRLDPSQTLEVTQAQSAIASDLDAMMLGDVRIFRRKEYDVAANWKFIMDGMLDSYHVLRLHGNSLGKYFEDTPTISEFVGLHIRQTRHRRYLSETPEWRTFSEMRRISTLAYALFPNGIVIVSPDYLNVGILRPTACDKTIVDYYLMADEPETREMEDKLERSFALMDQVFGQEDFWAAELGQQGVASGVLENLTLGGMEMQIAMFHESLDSCMAERSA